MNRAFEFTSFDAVSSVPARLSFSQLLLILTYVLLQASLPVQLGDHRLIQDILRRKDKDWEPRVGSEGILELQQDWHRTNPETRRIWDKIRDSMIQQSYAVLTVSAEHLRGQLGYLLHQIEQISSQCLNTFQRPKPRLALPSSPLGSREKLSLVGLSLAVTSTCNNESFISTLWDPDQYTVTHMLYQLHKSSLLRNKISSHDLLSALNSLGMIFSHEEQRVAIYTTECEIVRFAMTEWSNRDLEVQDRLQVEQIKGAGMEPCRETVKSRKLTPRKRRKCGSSESEEVWVAKRHQRYT